jgi:hypothetical protein
MSAAPANVSKNVDALAARRLQRLLNPLPAFAAHVPGSPERSSVEQYIANQFQAVHGATIHEFMPILLTMSCHGRISAATGIRAATERPLFLEQYLTRPIEVAIYGAAGTPVRRSRVAEIGNLVATRGGASYLLFMVLTNMLEAANFDWVVFTATPQVQKSIAYLGLETHVLGAADPERLTRSSAEEWGRYYDNRPMVVAGQVADAMNVLSRRKLCASALSLFRSPVNDLAGTISQASRQRGTRTLAA